MYGTSDEELDDEEELEPMRPPKDLLQTARDILGHNIAMKDLLQAWDACSQHTTIDARTTACMERLMAGAEAEDADQEAPARGAPKPRLDRRAAPAAEPLARKRSIVEVPDDSDEDDSEEDEGDFAQPSTSNAALKRKEPARRPKAQDRAAARERQAKRPKLTPGRVIDLEEDDDEDGDQSIEIISSPVKKKVAPPQDGSASSSSSAGNVAFLDRKRKESTPPTSGGDEDQNELGALHPAEPAGSTAKGKGKQVAEPKIDISPLAQVLAMVPDVEPSHAEGLVAQFIDYPNWIEHVVDKLFSGPSYPKAVIKPKASTSNAGASAGTSGNGDGATDPAAKKYMDKDRAAPSAAYIMLA
jgi:hypothetical protein